MIDASFASKRNEQLTIKTDSHFWRQMLISWFQVTRPQVGNWSLARLLDSASGSTTTHTVWYKKKKGEQCPDLSGFENVEPVFLALSVSSLRLHQTLQLLLWNMNWNFRKQCWDDCEWQSQQGSPHCVQSVRRDNKTSKCAISVITRDVTLENAANTFARSIKITLVKIPTVHQILCQLLWQFVAETFI